MSTVQPIPESPPARAVERIREIIVGRQLERIEQRIERLESAVPEGRPASEMRLSVMEARMEAMEQAIHRWSEHMRMEEVRRVEMESEVRRMALKIQQHADARSPDPAGLAVQQMEQRIGAWLGQWQLAMQSHLESRDALLIGQFRGEMTSLWEHVQVEMTRLRAGAYDHSEVEERFCRIADLARAMAACAEGSGRRGAQAP